MHITISELQKRYSSGFTLSFNRLDVAECERVGLVGNNGAGKTTMLRAMLGLVQFQRGTVLLGGRSVRRFDLRWRVETASYLGEASLLPFLTPIEYWQFVGEAYGIDVGEVSRRLEAFDGFVELADGPTGRKKFIRAYSEGNRKKIGLVAAMMVHPRLLVLDEPFTHLDPRSRMALEAHLLRLNAEQGTTLVISSHDLEHVDAVSSRMLLLEHGRLAFDGASGGGTLESIRRRLTSGYVKRAAI